MPSHCCCSAESAPLDLSVVMAVTIAFVAAVIGSGTVSNKDWSRGYSCIAEKRAIETIESGAPKTPFMQFGDTIRIEMKGRDGASLFGAIEQKVADATPSGR